MPFIAVTPLTILVAEDFSPFREFVCAQLHRRTGVHVVDVGDGLAAVQAAADLRPDLVCRSRGPRSPRHRTARAHCGTRTTVIANANRQDGTAHAGKSCFIQAAKDAICSAVRGGKGGGGIRFEEIWSKISWAFALTAS